jgi:hypothetical protein
MGVYSVMGPAVGAERHYNFQFWSMHAKLSKNKNPLSQKFFFLRHVPLFFKLNQLVQTAGYGSARGDEVFF